MKKWADKFVIGLTGNIGTGKSVVRRMLEHLGAYGIDADALSHRAIAKDAPSFQSIIETFGTHILSANGEIDRKKLSKIVFNDPEAMVHLESIIHPVVEQAIDLIVKRAPQKIIVIEAIKLLESKLTDRCDSIWVVYAPPEIQLSRLIQDRKMTGKEARKRIAAQIPQETRLARASVIIKNVSTFADAWQQVVTAWQRHVPVEKSRSMAVTQPLRLSVGEVNVQRVGPKQANEIVETINRLHTIKEDITRDQVMAAFGEKAFLLLKVDRKSMGILGWQVENLVARTTDILLDSALPPAQYLPILIREMERASCDLQCEASLIFVPRSLSRDDVLWTSLGYEQRQRASLGVLAWQEAVDESMPEGTVLFFKPLRLDRVLRPI